MLKRLIINVLLKKRMLIGKRTSIAKKKTRQSCTTGESTTGVSTTRARNRETRTTDDLQQLAAIRYGLHGRYFLFLSILTVLPTSMLSRCEYLVPTDLFTNFLKIYYYYVIIFNNEEYRTLK